MKWLGGVLLACAVACLVIMGIVLFLKLADIRAFLSRAELVLECDAGNNGHCIWRPDGRFRDSGRPAVSSGEATSQIAVLRHWGQTFWLAG